MNIPYRAAWCIVGLGMVGATAGYVYRNHGGPFAEAERRFAEDDQYQQEVGRGQKLKAQLGELPRIRDDKRRIANELIAGRLTLAEAATRFQELDGATMDAPTYARILKLNFPAASQKERICRKVIRHAVEVVGPQTKQAADLQAHLETELHELLAKHQSVTRKEG